jgi:molybdopterin-binding protein
VRNHLRGVVRAVTPDGGALLVAVDIGGAIVLARVTAAAVRELRIAAGQGIWVLVKAVSVSQHLLGTAAA